MVDFAMNEGSNMAVENESVQEDKMEIGEDSSSQDLVTSNETSKKQEEEKVEAPQVFKRFECKLWILNFFPVLCQNVDPDAENISEDELPGVQVAKVPETEEVSDEELPGPKRAELPADTEVSHS